MSALTFINEVIRLDRIYDDPNAAIGAADDAQAGLALRASKLAWMLKLAIEELAELPEAGSFKLQLRTKQHIPALLKKLDQMAEKRA